MDISINKHGRLAGVEIRHLVAKELSRRDASRGLTGPVAAQDAIENARRALADLEYALPGLAAVDVAARGGEHSTAPTPRTRPERAR